MTTAAAPVADKQSTLETWLLGYRFKELPTLVPGVALALAIALAAQGLSSFLGSYILRWQGISPEGKASPISAVALAVIMGLVVANTVGVSQRFAKGLSFSMKKLLRLGIILVGLKLSIVDVLKVGSVGVPVVIGLVAFALLATLGLAKAAKISPKLGSLAAASTAICGITATLAVGPVIEADEKEVAYTVANVTLFGLIAMLAYPYLAHALFASQPGAAGLFLGTAIHDTSQVMGAALSYKEVFSSERAAQVATVAKLTRNALLVVVVPVLALLHSRSHAGTKKRSFTLTSLLPVFVLGFLALSVVRSVGDVTQAHSQLALGLWDKTSWHSLIKYLGETLSGTFLGAALASVGLTTKLSVFKGLGIRPFAIGLAAALLVGAASLGLSSWIGPMLN